MLDFRKTENLSIRKLMEKKAITLMTKVNIAHRRGVSINVSLTYLTFRKSVDLCLMGLQLQQHYPHKVKFLSVFLHSNVINKMAKIFNFGLTKITVLVNSK